MPPNVCSILNDIRCIARNQRHSQRVFTEQPQRRQLMNTMPSKKKLPTVMVDDTLDKRSTGSSPPDEQDL